MVLEESGPLMRLRDADLIEKELLLLARIYKANSNGVDWGRCRFDLLSFTFTFPIINIVF